MASVKHAIREHDVVILRDAIGAWPAGTTGAVISLYDQTVLIEIADPDGHTLDTIQAPSARLEIKQS
jgi:hypothetical protein